MIAFRLSLILCFISSIIFSCSKEDSGSQGTHLKMIRSQDGDSVGYVFFKYDGQGRLNMMIDSGNNGYISKTYIAYDADGRLSKVTNEGTIYTFEFDNKGKIIKRFVRYPASQTTAVEDVYSYDINGRIIVDSIFSYWSGNLFETITYSYDQNNNITQSEVVDKVYGMLLGRYQYFYDNHPNPLNSAGLSIYMLNSGEEIALLGRNNLLTIKDSYGNPVNYTYEYNGDGFPKKRSLQDNGDPQVVYADYYYE
jgi:YD repeat-containing protein